jgi:hypothetical protein
MLSLSLSGATIHSGSNSKFLKDMLMTLDEYLIYHLDPELFEAPFYRFWVETIVGALSLLGPETDPDLDTLINRLLQSYAKSEWPNKVGETIRDEIVRLKGSGFWHDDSPFGLKYRCLFAVGTSVEENSRDTENWQYGVVTAFQLINLNKDKDEILMERIQQGLFKYYNGPGNLDTKSGRNKLDWPG